MFASREEVPLFVLLPSFLVSELKTAFQIGFLLFIPFLNYRFGGCISLNVNGHDDAVADYYFFTFQVDAFRFD